MAAPENFDEILLPSEEEIGAADAHSIRQTIARIKRECKTIYDAEVVRRTAQEGLNRTLAARIKAPKGDPKTTLTTDDRKNLSALKPDRYMGPTTESFTSWKKAFLNLADINKWSAAASIRMAYASMYKDARIATMHLDPDQFESLDDIMETFGKLFEPPATSEVARMEFDRIHQHLDETVLEYSNRIRAAFIRAYPKASVLTDAILQRNFIHGLASERVKAQTFRVLPQTFDAAIEAAMAESALLHSENMNTSSREKRFIIPASTFSGTNDTTHTVITNTLGAIGRGGRKLRSKTHFNKKNTGANKYCMFHKVTTHDTAECRSKGGKPSHSTHKRGKFRSKGRGRRNFRRNVNSMQPDEGAGPSQEDQNADWQNEIHGEPSGEEEEGEGCFTMKLCMMSTLRGSDKNVHWKKMSDTLEEAEGESEGERPIATVADTISEITPNIVKRKKPPTLPIVPPPMNFNSEDVVIKAVHWFSNPHHFVFATVLHNIYKGGLGALPPIEGTVIRSYNRSLNRFRVLFNFQEFQNHEGLKEIFGELRTYRSAESTIRKRIDARSHDKDFDPIDFRPDDLKFHIEQTEGAPTFLNRFALNTNGQRCQLDIETLTPLYYTYLNFCVISNSVEPHPNFIKTYYPDHVEILPYMHHFAHLKSCPPCHEIFRKLVQTKCPYSSLAGMSNGSASRGTSAGSPTHRSDRPQSSGQGDDSDRVADIPTGGSLSDHGILYADDFGTLQSAVLDSPNNMALDPSIGKPPPAFDEFRRWLGEHKRHTEEVIRRETQSNLLFAQYVTSMSLSDAKDLEAMNRTFRANALEFRKRYPQWRVMETPYRWFLRDFEEREFQILRQTARRTADGKKRILWYSEPYVWYEADDNTIRSQPLTDFYENGPGTKEEMDQDDLAMAYFKRKFLNMYRETDIFETFPDEGNADDWKDDDSDTSWHVNIKYNTSDVNFSNSAHRWECSVGGAQHPSGLFMMQSLANGLEEMESGKPADYDESQETTPTVTNPKATKEDQSDPTQVPITIDQLWKLAENPDRWSAFMGQPLPIVTRDPTVPTEDWDDPRSTEFPFMITPMTAWDLIGVFDKYSMLQIEANSYRAQIKKFRRENARLLRERRKYRLMCQQYQDREVNLALLPEKARETKDNVCGGAKPPAPNRNPSTQTPGRKKPLGVGTRAHPSSPMAIAGSPSRPPSPAEPPCLPVLPNAAASMPTMPSTQEDRRTGPPQPETTQEEIDAALVMTDDILAAAAAEIQDWDVLPADQDVVFATEDEMASKLQSKIMQGNYPPTLKFQNTFLGGTMESPMRVLQTTM